MASQDFIDDMNNWTEVVVDHLYDMDPVFACQAEHELGNIDQRFPNALRTPSSSSTSQSNPAGPVIPCFNTPVSRPPSGPVPIFGTPSRNPHNAWTPMHTGGATPNYGIQGDPNTPLPPPPISCCQCGSNGGCHCGWGTPQRRGSSFPSPFRFTSHRSPFARSTPIPQSQTPNRMPAPQNSQNPSSAPVWQAASNSPSRTMPTFPHEAPSLQQWTFPGGALTWSPHPAPHPEIPAAHFWTQNNGLRDLPANARRFRNTPLSASQAAQLTGGWPLPGTAPWWNHNVWPQNVHDVTSSPVQLAPCLIPNPADGDNPQIVWDVAYTPHGAKGLTPYATVNLHAHFNKMATNPAVDKIHVMIHDGLAQRIWGDMIIQNQNKVSVWDILYGIYAYFQTPITQQELEYLQRLDRSNHSILLDAARSRSSVAPGEIKRVDSLGGQRRFWGIWITDRRQEGWCLNLGLKCP